MAEETITTAPAPVAEKFLVRDSLGQVTEEATMVGGVLEGETIIYTAGRIMGRIQFQHGKREGEAIYYDNGGQVSVRSMYRDDLLHGESTYFDYEGRIVRKALYDRGELDGRATDFYPSGKAREVAHYTRGVLDGELLRFAMDGKLMERICYRRGKKVMCPPQVTPIFKAALKR